MVNRAIAAVLLLASCAPAGTDHNTCGIWLTQRPDDPNKDSLTQKEAATACVERWSARLAHGTDPARDIATAVVRTCNQEIERALTGHITHYDDLAPLTPATQAYWEGRAMFVAMQVRAKNCYPDA